MSGGAGGLLQQSLNQDLLNRPHVLSIVLSKELEVEMNALSEREPGGRQGGLPRGSSEKRLATAIRKPQQDLDFASFASPGLCSSRQVT